MTNKEAIHALKTRTCYECSYGCESPVLCSCFDCDLKKATILATEALERAEWVPVSERLPEHHKEVLVTGVSAISGKKVYSVKVWDVDRWRPESAPSIRWDAWMPLPEAYHPEEGLE